MIHPIVRYGAPGLQKPALGVEVFDEALHTLLRDMLETMYAAPGIGLAAPQIGVALRVAVIDLSVGKRGGEVIELVNPEFVEREGMQFEEEGCLSIPGIREDVFRQPRIRIHYFDENFNEFEETYDDINARVIQHEYDHIEGILFTDKLKPLTKKLVQPKLLKIQRGDFDADYRTKVYAVKK